MAWSPFDFAKPAATSNATDVTSDIRINEQASLVWQIITVGSIPGYAVTTNGAGPSGSPPDSQPTEIYYRRGAAATVGSVWLRVSLVWGTVGGAAGNVTQMTFAYSDNGGTSYDKMTMHGFDRATLNWTTDGDPSPSNFITWSLS